MLRHEAPHTPRATYATPTPLVISYVISRHRDTTALRRRYAIRTPRHRHRSYIIVYATFRHSARPLRRRRYAHSLRHMPRRHETSMPPRHKTNDAISPQRHHDAAMPPSCRIACRYRHGAMPVSRPLRQRCHAFTTYQPTLSANID